MSAANALPEILKLPRHVPVAHARESRRVRGPDALALRAVTRRAGRVQLAAAFRIAAAAVLGARVRERGDVRNDVLHCCVVGEHRCERDHLLAVRVVLVRAAYALFEALQLPRHVPAVLAGQLRRTELLVALALFAMTCSARREQRLARLRVAL